MTRNHANKLIKVRSIIFESSIYAAYAVLEVLRLGRVDHRKMHMNNKIKI